MAELVLVRHGQANGAATNEVDYDRLSDLGRQQAQWLGAWLRETDHAFDRTLSGTLSRQRGTAAAMGFEAENDPRWNELSYHPLAEAHAVSNGVRPPEAQEDFAEYFGGLLSAWSDGALHQAPESWSTFSERVLAAMEEARIEDGRTLVVTSGGVIGRIIGAVMDLDTRVTARMIAGIGNTAVQRLHWTGRRWSLAEYGARPHLAAPERVHARTYY